MENMTQSIHHNKKLNWNKKSYLKSLLSKCYMFLSETSEMQTLILDCNPDGCPYTVSLLTAYLINILCILRSTVPQYINSLTSQQVSQLNKKVQGRAASNLGEPRELSSSRRL